jgi:hypothetical protein
MKLKLLSTLALFGILSMVGLAQGDDDKGKGKMHGKTMTGCLSKSASGTEYLFVEEGTGKQITVAGNPDLSKHAANHKVKITTAAETPSSTEGATVTVSKIEHISDSCSATSK